MNDQEPIDPHALRVLSDLEAAGVRVYLEDGRLVCSPYERLTFVQRAEFVAWRGELARAVAARRQGESDNG